MQGAPATVLVPGERTAEWLGDAQVYSWYRSGGHPRPLVVVSALMALEKWLYDEMDAGHDVEPMVRQIVSASRSVAFAGVLVAVGKKRPELFDGPLCSLLGCWQLYRWDRLTTQHPLFGFDLSLSFHWDQQLWNHARDWHYLPHRQRPLEDLGIRLLLTQANTAEAFALFRRRWHEEMKSGDTTLREELERLCAVFNPNYYRLVQPAGGPRKLEFRWPEAMRRRRTRELAKVQPALRVIGLLERCQMLLAEDRELDDAGAEDIWRLAREVWRTGRARRASSAPDDAREQWVDAMTAAVACLSHLARAWLDQRPSRTLWCRKRLVDLGKEPSSGYLDAPSDLVSLWGRPHLTAVAAMAGAMELEEQVRRTM